MCTGSDEKNTIAEPRRHWRATRWVAIVAAAALCVATARPWSARPAAEPVAELASGPAVPSAMWRALDDDASPRASADDGVADDADDAAADDYDILA